MGRNPPEETAETRAEASEDDFFDALLMEEDRWREDSFGSPQVKPRDGGTWAFKTTTRTKKGRRGKRLGLGPLDGNSFTPKCLEPRNA